MANTNKFSREINQVAGDRFSVITSTLRDRGAPNIDPTDPDTWPIVDISPAGDSVRVDYFDVGVSLERRNIVAVPASDTISFTTHGFVDDDHVRFRTETTLPAGLVTGTLYFVISAAADTFQVSLTKGGAAVVITSTGTGIHTATKQYSTTVTTKIGGGSGGQFSFAHSVEVWERKGDYELEYVLVHATGDETVFNRDLLHLRGR